MDARTTAWVSYITPIGWIIAYINHNNALVKSPFATFHLRQSFGLIAISIAVGFAESVMVFVIPLLGLTFWILHIALVVLWLIGLINAINGEEKPLPVIGLSFQQWFTFIK
jgi:uncharacterized membrane protein